MDHSIICVAHAIAALAHDAPAYEPAFLERSRSISRMRGPQRVPWQLPLPEPVIRLISSLVCTPASSTFQNTLFLMPLQMQTTFIPSKRVRGGGVSAAG